MSIHGQHRHHSQKIAPISCNIDEYKMVEIRKKYIRVQHFNPKPKDKKFETETLALHQFEKDGNSMHFSTYSVDHRMQSVGTGKDCSVFELDNADGEYPMKENLDSHSNPSIKQPRNVILDFPKNLDDMKCKSHLTKDNKKNILNSSKISCDLDLCDTTLNTAANYSRPVIFFLHGVGCSSDTWRRQINYFRREGYEIVAPDLVGHGFSSAPKKPYAYQFSEIVSDIEELFDKFCGRKNVIIAHSYGCSFAAVLARKRSRKISKLVLISGGGPIPLSPQTGIFSLPIYCLSCCMPCVEKAFKSNAFHKQVDCFEETTFSVPTYVLSYIMNGQNWLEGDVLYHNWITVPSLLVYGANDKLIDITEEQDMAEAIYGSKLEVVQDAGHMVMVEAPDEVNELIHNFLLGVEIIEDVYNEDASSITGHVSGNRKERLRSSSHKDLTSPRERNLSSTSRPKSRKSAKKTQGPLRKLSVPGR